MKVTRKSKWMLSILFVFLLPSHLFSQAASMPMEAPTEGEPVTEVQEDETDEGGNRTIKGIIYDEQGETIIGASVLIKGEETTGTTSDMDGKFTLSVPQGSTLVISYIGYHPQEIKIRKRTALHVILKEDNQLLEEVVVVGYGWCSRGIAMRAAALGAQVIVTEIDPVKAIEAKMDGFSVMPMAKAAHFGDIFVTATGCCKTITTQHMMSMKDGVILANAGHFNCEIDMAALETFAEDKKERRNNVMGYKLPNGRWINVIGEGRLVNIAAADGHPAEIMDMSFAVQAMSAAYIRDNYKNLENKVIDVSSEIDDVIARRKLEAWGIQIDSLTEEQQAYLNSWQI